MTRILLANLPDDTSETRIRAALSPYAPIAAIEVIRQGTAPAAIVDFAVDHETADRLAHRLNGIWHAGRFLRASVLLHD